ncbi:hypothetical protein FOIG_12967 [Fusarium odoratissimum NRRL 54006]|uniref:Uncharacterized protein n=1 Tax=Fusarium odoratissimum (strain NRRL 54006) TaxID=1089451 RepID=X0KAM4_FUSO5|nr:uncharacterized protein FOIG_12967 [Fusarium odoratissimum NRRL 54006]EXL94034.1 hypothetical protein FOIG_12967 [Fusarium odoratissimum NRRL 54006]
MEKQARQGSFWGWDAVRSKRGITQGEQARAEIQIAEKKREARMESIWRVPEFKLQTSAKLA